VTTKYSGQPCTGPKKIVLIYYKKHNCILVYCVFS